MSNIHQEIEQFQFRNLHPHISLGTASDRYAGWIGQVYSARRYGNRTSRRPKTVRGKKFEEEVLPVESVAEYFEHFPVLELDFTFYGPLLNKAGKATSTYRTLAAYTPHLKKQDRLILKVPQFVFAKKLRRGGGFVENDQYLHPETFVRQFYEPARGMLDGWLKGFIFEQEYQRKQDRPFATQMAEDLDAFFEAVPKDNRYHVELRTEAFLKAPVFRVLEKHGVGQVLSHWTWLPSLAHQFGLSGRKFFNAGGEAVMRLMTPRGMRYEEAYAKAHPFNALVDGMLAPGMIDDTLQLMQEALARETGINVIINNRTGGNAPLIARRIANQFLGMLPG